MCNLAYCNFFLSTFVPLTILNLHEIYVTKIKNKQENIPVGITSNNRTFGCPIICTAFIQNVILFNDTSNNAGYNQFID